jgi:hypothetical protein
VLTIDVVTQEGYDEETEEFVAFSVFSLQLEHSLASLSKWESTYEKPFLSTMEKTPQELMGYIVAMTLTPNVPVEIYSKLSEQNIQEIDEYINSKQTATTFGNINEDQSREIVTAEIIYYWMVSMQIPFECQYWHLGRLLTLIRVVNLKNAPKKKMSSAEISSRNRELNAQRRAKLGTTG